jgi:4-amino-4-deoxy-L-arabinose transferase-like glycosyltransferase
VNAALAVVLLLAFWLRYQSAWFSYPLVTHADEPTLVGLAERMLDERDPNPRFFNYPSLIVYLQAATMGLLRGLARVLGTGAAPAPVDAYVAGRLVAASAAVASLWVVYRVGALCFQPAVGVLAALVLAICPIHVEHSALVTTDVWVATFGACVLLAATHVYREQRLLHYVLAGIALGLAVGSKYTAGCYALAIVVAHALASAPRLRALLDRRLFAAAAAAGVTFLATTPYALLDPREFLDDLEFERVHYRTGHFGAEAEGATSHGLYAGFLMSRQALGYGGIALALASLALVGRPEQRPILFIGAAPLALFLLLGSQRVYFARNLVGALPGLALLCAVSIHWIASRVGDRLGSARARWVTGLVLGAWVALPLAERVVYEVRDRRLPDTRWLALAGIAEHVPRGSRIAVEAYAPPVEMLEPDYEVAAIGVLGLTSDKAALLATADYAVLSSYSYGRLLDSAGLPKPRYGTQADVYRNFFDRHRLVYELDPEPGTRRGPAIRVYSLERR